MFTPPPPPQALIKKNSEVPPPPPRLLDAPIIALRFCDVTIVCSGNSGIKFRKSKHKHWGKAIQVNMSNVAEIKEITLS